jgi:hypothetical protein
MGYRMSVVMLALVSCGCLRLQANSTKSKSLPPGVLGALAADEKDYCDRFLGDFKKGCHRTFRAHLLWRQLVITPSGQPAILVENGESCGSAGCTLSLFVQQSDTKFVQVLGTGVEVGTLRQIKILKTVTNGHYDIQKIWHDGKTHTVYSWDGTRYSEVLSGRTRNLRSSILIGCG